MNKTFATLAFALMFGAAIPAYAEHHEGHKDKHEHMEKKAEYMLEKHDSNNDGKISREEHRSASEKMFNETDSNKDGFLSRDEIAAEKMEKKKDMKEYKKNN